MISTELDSFVWKFKQLWHSGIDAHLDVDTRAGQAWIGLRVILIEEICLLNILLDFSPNNLFAIRLCTIVNWAGPKKL